MAKSNLAFAVNFFEDDEPSSLPEADIHGEVLVLPEEMRVDYCLAQLLEVQNGTR